MLNLSNLFGKKPTRDAKLNLDEIAKMLKTTPEKLAEFEDYYQTQVLPELEPDMQNLNSRQAVAMSQQDTEFSAELSDIVDKIVEELISLTAVYSYEGDRSNVTESLPDRESCVSRDEIEQFPLSMRPQVSGYLMQKDISGDTAPILLMCLKKMTESKSEKERRTWYHQFRQGLDILDLDGLTYEMIGTNKNSMGYWLPKLVEANQEGFFQIPKTKIAKVPVTLLQLTRCEFMTLTETTRSIVNRWAMQVFGLRPDGDYFIKTGTYSSKFDFRNCRVHDPKEISELGEYLLFIHFDALMKASPLCQPCIYGMSTTNEWVVREYIKDVEHNPVIYKGLPLHTEYRVFVDCDRKTVLGIRNYWDPDTMKKRFEENRDGHDAHDYITFTAHEETMTERYQKNKDNVVSHIEALLPALDLPGQWSIDIMQNGKDFWLIDMALAENSAGYQEAVPERCRNPLKENWLPLIDC